MQNVNQSRLFNASCIALTVTAMTFAIRAGILSQLGEDFKLTDTELGWVNAMAFLGFPIATMIGGPLYNAVGPRKIMWVAFITHLLGLILTIFAGGFWTLLISTLFIGFANGSVEAACNPMIANMYENDKTTMLNKFHVWFPGGIVIGALVSGLMTNLGMGWQLQIAIMLIPTLIYAWMIFGQKFPEEPTEQRIDFKKLFPPTYLTIVLAFVLIAASDLTLQKWFSPEISAYVKFGLIALVIGLIYRYFGLLYTILALCMTLTATAELGTQQWVEKILGNSGAHPMIILAMVTGLMAVGRYFGGPLIHKFKPVGVLWGSAIIATLGIGLMSIATGGMVYLAAILFAIGVMYFWPTMIGAAAEYTPQTGALGLSFLGGVGMFATSLWQPIIGGWLDSERATALQSGMTAEAAELVAGQATLDNLAVFPAILIILFGGLYFYLKNQKSIAN